MNMRVKVECKCSNCFECPYPDCIITDKQLSKILSAEKKAEREKNKENMSHSLKYYYEHTKARQAYNKKYYREVVCKRAKNGAKK